MRTHRGVFGGPELLIVIGSGLFIFVLGLSAYFEADIRWLHFFQGWMYLATIALSLCHNRWGYFIGISAAVLWDYINLFVTTFFRNGLHCLGTSVTTGQIQHVDQIIAVPAWIGNFLVLMGCIWAYGRLAERNRNDLVRFVDPGVVPGLRCACVERTELERKCSGLGLPGDFDIAQILRAGSPLSEPPRRGHSLLRSLRRDVVWAKPFRWSMAE